MKLGKKPARHAVSLRMISYLMMDQLPAVPDEFGHENLVTNWGVLGNTAYGDCVWAGAAHETMLWCGSSKREITFDDAAVLSDYAAATGFDPANPNSDQGTDVADAAKYRRDTGIIDAHGSRHKVAAYVALRPGSIEQLALATYLFGAVGIGVQFPSTAMDQFDRNEPWSPVTGASIDGGHYIPIVARRAGMFYCVTWGRLQPVTPQFLSTYMDEGIAYLSEEMMIGGKSIEGFDMEALAGDLYEIDRRG